MKPTVSWFHLASAILTLGHAAVSTTALGAVLSGAAVEVAPDVVHPNGNIYDQVLMTGAQATVKPDPGQLVRISFLDPSDDIVQVEYAGAGSITVAFAPTLVSQTATKYNQPNVVYVKGHAAITIQGADNTSNILIYTVGPQTAVNLSVIKAGETYDGWADIQVINILPNPESPNGAVFGSIFAGNVHFSSRSGYTGILAPTTQVQGVVNVGDITAVNAGIPVLWFGSASQFGSVNLTGGVLEQLNDRAILIHYLFVANVVSGSDSSGRIYWYGQQSFTAPPGATIKGRFQVVITGP